MSGISSLWKLQILVIFWGVAVTKCMTKNDSRKKCLYWVEGNRLSGQGVMSVDTWETLNSHAEHCDLAFYFYTGSQPMECCQSQLRWFFFNFNLPAGLICVFVAVIKHWPNTWIWNSLFHITFLQHNEYLRVSKARTQYRNMGKGTEAETVEE